MEGKEELVSYKVAKLAKDKGFNWKVIDSFDDKKNPVSRYNIDVDGLDSYINTGDEEYIREVFELNNDQMQSDFVARPTQSLLQKWLRDKYKINIQIPMYANLGTIDYAVSVDQPNDSNTCMCGFEEGSFKTYEKALEIGLEEALKML